MHVAFFLHLGSLSRSLLPPVSIRPRRGALHPLLQQPPLSQVVHSLALLGFFMLQIDSPPRQEKQHAYRIRDFGVSLLKIGPCALEAVSNVPKIMAPIPPNITPISWPIDGGGM